MQSTTSPDQLLRRKYPRRGFRRKLGILFDGKYWMGNGVEVGEGGLSFLLGQAFPEGRSVVVNFQVPEGGFVSVQAEIRHITKDRKSGLFQYGVLFKTLKFEQKREIRSYVSARTEFEQ
jgi:c-di-GMP-binding flagellar brake protein YcgR